MNNNHKFKILIVDDRDENLLALESILQDEKYTLIKAKSGKAALSILLNDQDFHLILLDVLMPVMDGFETAELIYHREKLADVPIIFLTARDIEGNIYKGYQAGAIDYIRKPISPELLNVKVKAFVELSEKTRELVRQEERLRTANENLRLEIAERRRSEAEVKLLNESLQKRLDEVQSLDSFNYSISHDLMSPLASVTSLTNLIRSMPADKVSDDVLEIAEHIRSSCDRMTKLIKALLNFSKQAHLEISRTEFNMKYLVTQVIEDISIAMPLDKVEVTIQDMPMVQGDNMMLRQVWVNLISNAVKYSLKTEAPRIEIGVKQDQGKTIYFVKDNGVGFDMKNYNKLFGIFQRLHTEKEFSGTGVGLALVKRIVEKHQGKVWAESDLGKGSNFYFTLNDNAGW